MISTLRRLTAVALACCLLTAATCNKASVTSAASDVLTSMRAAQPIIAQLIPKAAAKFDNALTIAEKLNGAIKANEMTNAAAFLADLIPVFEDITNRDINGLSAAQKTTILAVLAVADISLSFLANHLKSNAPSLMTALPNSDAVSRFASQPVWGEAYKKK